MMHQVLVRGLHAETCDRSARGQRLFHYQRLLLLMVAKNGKPRLGERFPMAELCAALGLSSAMLYHAVRDLKNKGVCILTERPYPTAGGQYFMPKTEAEARVALDVARVDLRGRVSVQRSVVESMAGDFPALAGQAPMLITDDVLAQIGGAVALEIARRLTAEGEGLHALSAASA